MAQEDSKKSKILASLTIAQAILESGDGNSGLTVQGNALFGIKANKSWRGKVWTGSTVEYYDGTRTSIVAGFRAYDSWQESIADHSELLTGLSRYKAVVGETDYKKACKAIQAAGYATDPLYATKLIGLIEVNQLYKYDNVVEEDKELSRAVSKIIKSGIKIDFNSWERRNLIKLANVPELLIKLGGIDKLAQEGIISQRVIWDKGTYTVNNVRSLLIKYAATL
ncbi:MAG: hypothetical protein E7211_20640 [Clostridium lundense]|nr:hypothetical protein [Clostridium lundense]